MSTVTYTIDDVGKRADDDYFCQFTMTDDNGNQTAMIRFPKDTTPEQLHVALEMEAEKWGKRTVWLESLQDLKGQSFEVDVVGVGPGNPK